MIPIKVNFSGKDLWWQKEEDGSGALALLEHCDENGNILMNSAFDVSFAHVNTVGYILRFGEIIGHREDLFKSKLV